MILVIKRLIKLANENMHESRAFLISIFAMYFVLKITLGNTTAFTITSIYAITFIMLIQYQIVRTILRSTIAATVGLFFLAIAVGIGYSIYESTEYAKTKRENKIIDDYIPSANLMKYAGLADLTEEGYRLLYLNTPELSTNKKIISEKCDKHKKSESLTLGCYSPTEQKIFLLDFDEYSLSEFIANTVAHEVLHVAWSRLDSIEKERIKVALDEVYSLHTDDLKNRMSNYNITGDAFYSELHSIVGTEIEKLNDVLDIHYSRYLTQRNDLTFANAVFIEERKQQSEQIERVKSFLKKLKKDIDLLDSQVEKLGNEITSIQKNEAKDNSAEAMSGLIISHTKISRSLNSKITTYNTAVKHYNSLAKESNYFSEIFTKEK